MDEVRKVALDAALALAIRMADLQPADAETVLSNAEKIHSWLMGFAEAD